MIIDPNHKSGNAALDRACAHIGDAFRPERKQRESVILSGHRVQSLVEAGRSDFTEACRALEVDAQSVETAHLWLVEDGCRLNETYGTKLHERSNEEYKLIVWMVEQEQAKIVQMPRAS
jgi:hypothetical protein